MDHFELVSRIQTNRRSACRRSKSWSKGSKKATSVRHLLGVTGSGKTFTMANVIQQLNKPTLIIAHNKTLAAQLIRRI